MLNLKSSQIPKKKVVMMLIEDRYIFRMEILMDYEENISKIKIINIPLKKYEIKNFI